MKITIVVHDDSGQIFEGEAVLAPARLAKPSGRKAPVGVKAPSTATQSIDFDLPPRAFMKQRARHASGPKKFVLLLAHMTKGNTTANVQRVDVEKLWNRMTAILSGEFNGAYATRAKENGWVDTPRHGVYKLLPGWAKALNDDAGHD
jgi:hypothetical protein